MAIALSMLQPIDMCADDWPQWRGPNRDGVWRESGIFDAIPARKAGSGSHFLYSWIIRKGNLYCAS